MLLPGIIAYMLALCLLSQELSFGGPVDGRGGVTPVLFEGVVERGSKIYCEKDGAEMVYVPEGEFIMGSNMRGEEKPSKSVYLNAFYIYKCEVTNAQFRKFIEETDYIPWTSVPGDDNYPVAFVSYADAAAYAKWAGKRLPTEAEWEKAARGEDGRKYPWGEEWSASRCNVHSFSERFKYSAPVGSFEIGKSVYGCYDMAGNVWEWCADWFNKNSYSEMPYMNPKGPETGKKRVLRGGSWRDIHYKNDVTRCAARVGCVPAYKADFIGFRCVEDK